MQELTSDEKKTLSRIFEQYLAVESRYNLLHDRYQGYALIKEAFDNLWENIRHDSSGLYMQVEAFDLAAKVFAFIVDLTPHIMSLKPDLLDIKKNEVK
jgi:hypothetical protein